MCVAMTHMHSCFVDLLQAAHIHGKVRADSTCCATVEGSCFEVHHLLFRSRCTKSVRGLCGPGATRPARLGFRQVSSTALLCGLALTVCIARFQACLHGAGMTAMHLRTRGRVPSSMAVPGAHFLVLEVQVFPQQSLPTRTTTLSQFFITVTVCATSGPTLSVPVGSLAPLLAVGVTMACCQPDRIGCQLGDDAVVT